MDDPQIQKTGPPVGHIKWLLIIFVQLAICGDLQLFDPTKYVIKIGWTEIFRRTI